MKVHKMTNIKFKKFWSDRKKLIALSSVIILPSIAGLVASSYVPSIRAESNHSTIVKAKDSQIENYSNNLTQAAIIDSLAKNVRIELNSNNKLSKEDLDAYAYYFIKYLESGVQYYSPGGGNIDTADSLLDSLGKLYSKNDLMPPFVKSKDGLSFELKETLSEPSSFKDLHKKVKTEVVDPALKNKNDKSKAIDVDVTVKEGEVSLYDK